MKVDIACGESQAVVVEVAWAWRGNETRYH